MGYLSRLMMAVYVCAGMVVAQRPAVLQPDSVQLVRAAVANEVENTSTSDFWMYRLTKETKSGIQVKDMVETKDGIVARLVSVNGRALTEAERETDDQRLDHLARTP